MCSDVSDQFVLSTSNNSQPLLSLLAHSLFSVVAGQGLPAHAGLHGGVCMHAANCQAAHQLVGQVSGVLASAKEEWGWEGGEGNVGALLAVLYTVQCCQE